MAWNLTDAARQRIVEMRKESHSAREILVALQNDGLIPKTATERGMRYHLNTAGMGGRRAPSSNRATSSRAPSRLQKNKVRDHRVGTRFETLWTPAADKILEREWNKGTPIADIVKILRQSGTLARKAPIGLHSLYSEAFRLRKSGRPIVRRGSGPKNGGRPTTARPATARPILDAPIPARGRVRHVPDDTARIPIALTAAQAARLVELLLQDKE